MINLSFFKKLNRHAIKENYITTQSKIMSEKIQIIKGNRGVFVLYIPHNLAFLLFHFHYSLSPLALLAGAINKARYFSAATIFLFYLCFSGS